MAMADCTNYSRWVPRPAPARPASQVKHPAPARKAATYAKNRRQYWLIGSSWRRENPTHTQSV